MIASIHFRKATGEYLIKRRNDVTGEKSTTMANHLTEEEKSWARENASTRHETPYEITWTQKPIRR